MQTFFYYFFFHAYRILYFPSKSVTKVITFHQIKEVTGKGDCSLTPRIANRGREDQIGLRNREVVTRKSLWRRANWISPARAALWAPLPGGKLNPSCNFGWFLRGALISSPWSRSRAGNLYTFLLFDVWSGKVKAQGHRRQARGHFRNSNKNTMGII